MDIGHLCEELDKAIRDAGIMRFVYLDQELAKDIQKVLANCRDGLPYDSDGHTETGGRQLSFKDIGLEGDDHVRQQ